MKQFNVCTNAQMSNFNGAPLPDPVGGAQQFSLFPGGGMLVADFAVIARLDASGKLVATYNTPAGNHCWLGMELDPDGTSFWAGDWCGSSVTRFDIATGNVIEADVAAAAGFMVKQIAIPGNIFSIVGDQYGDRCGRRRVEFQQQLSQRRYNDQSARATTTGK